MSQSRIVELRKAAADRSRRRYNRRKGDLSREQSKCQKCGTMYAALMYRCPSCHAEAATGYRRIPGDAA